MPGTNAALPCSRERGREKRVCTFQFYEEEFIRQQMTVASPIHKCNGDSSPMG